MNIYFLVFKRSKHDMIDCFSLGTPATGPLVFQNYAEFMLPMMAVLAAVLKWAGGGGGK